MTRREQQYGSGTARSPDDRGALRRRRLVRRKFLKLGVAGGAALLASAYVKPAFLSVGSGPAYAATPVPGGCTPGYWKNHPGVWPAPYDTDPLFSSVFTVPSEHAASLGGTKTLSDVLTQGGGCEKALGRHGVAALLNARGTELGELSGFPLTVPVVVVAVNDALAGPDCGQPGSTIESTKNYLEGWNEQSCPLGKADDLP